ncbi:MULTISPECIES: membrane protein insertase YidC [unclassified Lentimonas]|uniref:membrane protein insertase YidC n=1 Tax=unclassified Lentimonas TaxID=2630993 RepID=UPI001326D5AB|nr:MULTISPECIES: membrane protein insertase YidC [unclassified Lentimonas]CAA6691542.1 Inner membrane protein translocase component YidC, long form [Lentimonas sp. CC10]CAA6696200.1 Inner membrane protein translocase component YidC, long form [Lentimonas sp. CC19]CAA7070886.1 Inner membrane protein translocase component YidC, long form [Lentimonas sp. CC11]
MDKKNTILGIICIVAGIGYMYKQTSDLNEQQRQQALEEASVVEQAVIEAPEADVVSAAVEVGENAEPSVQSVAPVVALEPVADEQIVTLSNEYIEVEFTTHGGAIRTVSFLQTKNGERDEYVFNARGRVPALSLSLAARGEDLQQFTLPYAIEQQTADSITFAYQSADGLVLRRQYSLATADAEHDPYVIRHSTSFGNSSEAPRSISAILNLGTAWAVSEKQLPAFLNVGHFDGEDAEFVAINKLTGGKGFLGMGASAPVEVIEEPVRSQWASVKNQFFAAVLSSDQIARDLFIYPVEGPLAEGGSTHERPGISGSVGYEVGLVPAGSAKSLDFNYYVGPKEFKRLQALGNHEDEVMQFGFLSFISKLLLSFMYAIHSIVPSWGWSIVIMTVCIKTLFWPLSAKASRSQKRMAKIQGPMAELKEKYKDNPQKLQQETLKVFKENKVNPVAGCLPMIIQMPIFLGLFYMLRSASELRHESFLWVSDLSMPDTLTYIAGYPLNILPLIMGLTMFFQMRMMPVSPTADPAQQKIFKFLPFIFLIFLYNFSSGLVLYWTVQNLLTILQQKIINSRPDEELAPVVAAKAATPTGKGGSPSTKSRKKK